MFVYVGQGNMFPEPDNNGLLYNSLRSPGLHCRVIQVLIVYWSGENKAPDTTNITLLKDTVSEVVESWFFQGGNLTGVRYSDEILDAYVLPYAA